LVISTDMLAWPVIGLPVSSEMDRSMEDNIFKAIVD